MTRQTFIVTEDGDAFAVEMSFVRFPLGSTMVDMGELIVGVAPGPIEGPLDPELLPLYEYVTDGLQACAVASLYAQRRTSEVIEFMEVDV